MLPVLRHGSGVSALPFERFGRFDSLFDRFFGEDGTFPASAWGAAPLAMWQDDDHLYIEAELPGVAESDVDLTVHQGSLTIRAQRKPEEGRKYLFNNRAYGRFERVIGLPEGIDGENVQARLSCGVLLVTFGKSAQAKPKKIAVAYDR